MHEGSRANMNYPLGYQVNPPDLANSVSLTRLTLDKQLNVVGEEPFSGSGNNSFMTPNNHVFLYE